MHTTDTVYSTIKRQIYHQPFNRRCIFVNIKSLLYSDVYSTILNELYYEINLPVTGTRQQLQQELDL